MPQPITTITDKYHGTFAVSLDVQSIYRLTPCCGASGKGSMVGDRPAIVCRGCYNEVEDVFGYGASIDPDTYSIDLSELQRLMDPCKADTTVHSCAAHLAWEIAQALPPLSQER